MSDLEYHGAVELRFYGTGAQVRQQIAALFGSTSLSSPGTAAGQVLYEAGVKAAAEASTPMTNSMSVRPLGENVAATPDAPAAGEEAPKRKRRTKAEMEAAAAAEAASKEPEPAIRTNPEDRQDPAEVQAQDAADEAAEEDPNTDNVDSMFDDEPEAELPPVTAEDVKKALGRWLHRAGDQNNPQSPILTSYKTLFTETTGGAFTTLKELTDKKAPADVMRSLITAIDKQAA